MNKERQNVTFNERNMSLFGTKVAGALLEYDMILEKDRETKE